MGKVLYTKHARNCSVASSDGAVGAYENTLSTDLFSGTSLKEVFRK